MMLNKLILTIIIVLSGTFTSFATHLIGGNLGYEYIGTVNIGGVTKYRYKIILHTYTNCGPDSNIPDPENPIQDIGIYSHDVNGDPFGGGAKTFITSVPMGLISTTRIEPELPGNCSVGASTCINEGVYEGFVNLDLSFTGYHAFYDRCCRNGSIANLTNPNIEGMGFHAYIGPTLVGNSSPVFTDVPVPFLCVDDTTTILNSANDADGDQMVFSFIDPSTGFGGQGNPAPPPITPTMGWPLPTVGWGAGYSSTQPFGAAGYSFIDGATGLTAYASPNVGDYVVCVQIVEYNASGNIVGVTRRDLQLLVLNCPTNPAPLIDPNAGTTANSFDVIEGETLCFDFGFNDPNADSLTLTVNGQLFDPGIISPAATIDAPVLGLDTVSTEFCWSTGCGQAQTLPYQFNVSVTDNGCPPKTTNEVYLITVLPVSPPDMLSGDEILCLGDTGTYTTELIAGNTYNWIAINGVILSTTNNTAQIIWDSPGTGTVQVSTTSSFGCSSTFIDMPVTVVVPPTADAGNDISICFGDTIQIGGSPTGTLGSSFTWTPNTNISSNSEANPSVWPNVTTDYIVDVALGGVCTGKDTITVTVGLSGVDAGPDGTICFGDSLQFQASGGTDYQWTPGNNLSSAIIPDPFASPLLTTEYFVEITDGSGCVFEDSLILTVTPLPNIITSDITTCDNECAQLNANGGTDYLWSPSIGLDDPTSQSPLACITNNATYQVLVTENGCSDSVSIDVTVNASPTAHAGIDTTICENDCFDLSGNGGLFYSWLPTNVLSDADLQSPNACPMVSTDFELTVTDANGCMDVDSVNVIVNDLPAVNAGSDISFCVGDSVQLIGSGAVNYIWSLATGLSNPNIFNPIAKPATTTTYTLTSTDANMCSNSDDITVTVNTTPVITTIVDSTICLNESVQLFATGGTSYLWSPAISLDNENNAAPIATPSTTTTYNVIVTDGNGCVDSSEVTITVNPLPVINAGLDDTLCIGSCINLLANGGINYTWTPATGLSNASIANPVTCPVVTTEYEVSADNAFGCFNTDTVIVVVNPLPNVSAGLDVEICNTHDIQLDGTGATDYSWSPITDLSDPLISDPIASPSITTTYTVTGTDDNGCINTDDVIVTVNPLPAMTISVDTSICFGDSASIFATGGTNYTWTPTAGIGNSNSDIIMASPATTTIYTAHVIDGNGCEDSLTVTVTVNALPAIEAGANVDLCIGDTTLLTATNGVTYTWTPTDSLENPLNDATNVWPTDSTEYFVTGTDLNGCINIDSVTVNVLSLPIVDAGDDQWLCPGAVIQLNGSGTGTVLWTPNATLSADNILDPISSATDTAEYILQIIDASFCVNTDTSYIYVNDDVPSDAGPDTTICFNDTVMIGGNPSSVNGTVFLWQPALGLDDPTLANPMASPTVTTTYYLHTTNDTCTGVDTMIVTVNQLPLISAGNDIQICIGDTARLSATNGTEYAWATSLFLTDTSIFNPLAFPTDTTDFIVTGTDLNGCQNKDTVAVIVNPLPSANAGLDIEICLKDSVQLAAIGGNEYAWTPNTNITDSALVDPFVFPIVTTEYIVFVTDSNNCVLSDSVIIIVNNPSVVDAAADTALCIGDTIQISASGSVDYVWTPDVEISDDSIFNPMVFATTTTEYFVTGTDNNGCNYTDSITVTVNELPIAEAGNAAAICIGANTQLNASGGVTYNWTPAATLDNASLNNPTATPITTTEYFVTVEDANNCVNIDSVAITVNDLPTVNTGPDVNICLNASIQLNATGGVNYLWNNDISLSDNEIANPIASPDTTTQYIVTVTDANSCINSDTLVVSVFDFMQAPKDTTICFGESVPLFVAGQGATGFTWTPATDLNDPNIHNPIATPITTITYSVEITDAICFADSSFTITVIDPPTSIFSTKVDAGCDGVLVEFFNESMDEETLLWLFTDGTMSTVENPVHTFNYSTNFGAELIAINNFGCTDTSSFDGNSGSFEDYFDIAIPNVFTPNDDGQNDLFVVEVAGKLYECVDMSIYNRWGQIIYRSTGNNLIWDGRTMQGTEVAAGTYFYTIKIREQEFKGHVTVFR